MSVLPVFTRELPAVYTAAKTARGIARAYYDQVGWPTWSTRETPMSHRVYAVQIEGDVYRLFGLLGTAKRPLGRIMGPFFRVSRKRRPS